MSEIRELIGLNISELLIGIIVLLVSFKFVAELMDWIFGKIKHKFKKNEAQETAHDLLVKHTEELQNQKEQIDKIVISVNQITQKLDDMQERDDSSQRRKLKDRIAQAYRIYHEKECWTQMEKEAFDGLIEDYESHGGQNSFVHDICQPESYTWKIIN